MLAINFMTFLWLENYWVTAQPPGATRCECCFTLKGRKSSINKIRNGCLCHGVANKGEEGRRQWTELDKVINQNDWNASIAIKYKIWNENIVHSSGQWNGFVYGRGGTWKHYRHYHCLLNSLRATQFQRAHWNIQPTGTEYSSTDDDCLRALLHTHWPLFVQYNN